MNKNIIKEIQSGLVEGKAQRVKEKVTLALSHGIKPEVILEEGLISPMNAIGAKFRSGEIFIPTVLMSSRAMHAGLYVLKPVFHQDYKIYKGTIVIGTVAGDLHDIGKNMVSMILQSEGYYIIDLGIDVPASDFVDAVGKYKPNILGLSALLTTTMNEQGEVLKKLQEAGLREKVKVMIGGGPVTKKFSMEIGADAYGGDLFDAVKVADKLLAQNYKLNEVSTA